MPLSRYPGAGLGHQRRLSDQRRGEPERAGSATPPGREAPLLLFHVDPSPVDVSCFSLRLVPKLTGSFEAFPPGDVDAVIWMALLGPDPPRHGFLRIQATSRLPCREPLCDAPLSFLIQDRSARQRARVMDASEERAAIKEASRKDFGLYGNVVSSFHPSTLRSRQTGTKFTF